MASERSHPKQRVSTGTAGLDDVLDGGLPPDRIYLVQGDPGTGKTTLALQFLLEGARRGESGLYVSLSETREEIRDVAASHGWSLDGIALFELAALEGAMAERENTLFDPSAIDLHETTRTLLAEVERVKPVRVVFDSLSELRLLAEHPLRYRRQILELKQFFAGRRCTVLLLDDRTSEPDDLQLQSLAHGVVFLEQKLPEYGAERRRMRVLKMRGVKFSGGYHDFIVRTGGIEVFPRLIAREHQRDYPREQAPTGIAELDALIGGGLDRGTSTLIMGPAGTGKSVITARIVFAAAERGERSALFTFEEGTRTLLARSAALGMPLEPHIDAGRILLRQIDPAEVSPGEFDAAVLGAVEREGVRLVAIDSLNGYVNAMPEDRYLTIQMHELLSYLAQQGIVTVMVLAQHGLLGASMTTRVDVSYLADTVILTRFFEASGAVQRAISVTKRRGGEHEDTIRRLSMSPGGIHIGAPLVDFHGVLTGIPTYAGTAASLDPDGRANDK